MIISKELSRKLVQKNWKEISTDENETVESDGLYFADNPKIKVLYHWRYKKWLAIFDDVRCRNEFDTKQEAKEAAIFMFIQMVEKTCK